MNMHVALTETSIKLLGSRIVTKVNGWQGACMQSFAQAEAAVTETLLLLSEVPGRGANVKLCHTVGQGLEDLLRPLGSEGGFPAEHSAAFEALSKFRQYEEPRTDLAQDVARIALERIGTWVVVFRHLSIRSRVAERGTTAFEQKDALRKLQALKPVTHRLDAALGNLRRTIEDLGGVRVYLSGHWRRRAPGRSAWLGLDPPIKAGEAQTEPCSRRNGSGRAATRTEGRKIR